MEKKKWISVASAAGLVILIIFLIWAWSLGAVASEETQKTYIEVTRDTVEWRSASSDEWQPISGAREIFAQDHIRTGETGEAQIRWGDRGVTRLDPETEVTVETVASGETLYSAVLNVRVESGRVWNRVLKILDIDGGMRVETSDVVATVRGTAFGVAKETDSTDIAVTESVVSVPSALVREGQWGSFNASGTIQLRQLTDADSWAIVNAEKDRVFDEQMKQMLFERFRARTKVIAPVWLMRASERAHLALVTGDKKKDLAEKYALRHLAMGALDKGKRDAHLDVLRARIKTADTRANRILSEANALAVLLASEGYKNRSGVGDFINQLRELRSGIAVFSEETSLYRDAIGIDDRIDDYLFGPSTGDSRSKDGKELLFDLAAFIEDLEHNGDLSVPAREQLRKKGEALGYRLGFDTFTPESDHTFSDALVGGDETSTQETTEQNPATGAVNPDGTTTNERRFNAFQFYATPMKASIGEPIRMSLYGITPDGVALNVSEEAVFSTGMTSAGEIQGNYFYPAQTGEIALYAVVNDAGMEKRLSLTVTVESATVQDTGISDVQFEFQGPTTLICGASVPFKVMAKYIDGSSKDVTIMSKESVSDPNLIHVQDDRVLAYCAPQTASAEVYATYEEGGKRFTAVGVITIEPEPEPIRSVPQTTSPVRLAPTTLY